MSKMAGMAMSVKEASSSMNNTANNNNNNNNNNNTGISSTTGMTNSGNAIKNITEYQTAQALAGIEVFRKDLNPIAPSTLKAANTEIQNDLNQLKTAIDNKAPFIDVMKIVYIEMHPTLITAYNLQLKSFQ
jgi:hypothetical protein